MRAGGLGGNFLAERRGCGRQPMQRLASALRTSSPAPRDEAAEHQPERQEGAELQVELG